MDAYVGVTNAASSAVKSILQLKKAFRKQMKCIEESNQRNESLQKTIRQFEKENKGLLALVSVFMQDEDDMNCNTKNASKQCPSASRSNEKDKKDIIPIVNTPGPTSPKTSNNQGFKRKCTPEKPVPSRKSRRISTRK